jgi:hypothetical protein
MPSDWPFTAVPQCKRAIRDLLEAPQCPDPTFAENMKLFHEESDLQRIPA